MDEMTAIYNRNNSILAISIRKLKDCLEIIEDKNCEAAKSINEVIEILDNSKHYSYWEQLERESKQFAPIEIKPKGEVK